MPLVHSHSIYVVGTDSAQDYGNDGNNGYYWREEIFEKIFQYISDGYAVAYVGDESKDEIIQHFSSEASPLIIEYIDKGLLTIINRDVFYSPFVPSKVLLEQWNKLFANIEKKVGSGNFKGFVGMGMPADSFFLSEVDSHQLVRYESLASKKYNGRLDAICLYTNEMIQRMPLRHIISLLNAHQNTGHKNETLREWNSKRGLSLIKRGIDSALSPSVSDMVLSMIVRDFGIDEMALVTQPDQFERKLELLMGPPAARVIIDNIKKEIGNDIIYSR